MADGRSALTLPAKDEVLHIGDVSDATADSRVTAALKRLAAEKAPPSVAQLAIWKLVSDRPWDELASLSRPWSNGREVSLARRFVERLDDKTEGSTASVTDPAAFYWVVFGDKAAEKARLASIESLLKDRTVVGLTAKAGIPAQPDGPSLACEARITGSGDDAALDVRLATADPAAPRWKPAGRFTVSLVDGKKRPLEPADVVDALAEKVLERLVQAKLSKGPRVKGKETFVISFRNTSPLVLNGLALSGKPVQDEKPELPSLLSGLSVPPGKTFSVPATAEVVERLHLKGGVRVIAADLSGL